MTVNSGNTNLSIEISTALEDYLEAIYILSLKNPAVRITDVANHLNISKPSANRAVNSLKHQGFVTHEPYGDIFLTELGTSHAKLMHDRYILLKSFFTNVLGTDEDEAERISCMMEHSVSDDTLEKINKLVQECLSAKQL